ncbi:MAG: toxin TcdB middle/N-terminal domain-containing protein, partial [Burkholderiales bacterium]
MTTNGIFGGFSYSALHAEYFTFADLNNDGRTDLLEQRETSANLSVPDDRFMTAAVNDANPKGRGTYKNQYRYFHNTGAGFAGSTYSISTGEEFVVLGTGDFNGDGALDIVVETKVGSTLAQRICVSPLASSTAAPSSPITFTCGDPLPASLGISNFVDRLPFVVDALGNGLSSIYGPYNYGSFGEPLGATLCVVSNPAGVTRTSAPVMSCSLRADAPAGVLRPVERNVQFIENQRFDHISIEQMVDFSGTGKPNNVRWTKPYLTRFTDDGGTTVTSQWRWLNKQPMLVATDFAANMASTTNAIASYVYPAYDLPTRPNPFLAEFPYQFDVGKYGSNAADFNGSGYSSTAFGFIEYQSGRYNPNRTDFTVCISTGRALDCRVRKKYSGLDVTDGATTEPLLRYRQLRSIGQFEGDGAPTLLMERLSMGADQLKPIGTGRIQFCRLMGDDTTGGSGANDDNFSCRDASLPQEIFRGYLPEDINTTGRAFPVFFGDFLGTGRTQIMSYKGGAYQNGVWVENGTWELYEPIDRALPGQALDRIHRVTNGIGHVSSVEYADGVASGIVTRSGTSTLTYPRYVTSGVGKIVRRVTISQGGFAIKSTRYDYQDAAVDVSGRGSLGFARVVSTDEQSNITTTTTYAQSWPYTGMVTATASARGAVTLSNTTNVLRTRAIPQSNGIPTTFTYIASSSTSKADLNGASLGSEVVAGASSVAPFADEPEVTYDDWGNLLRMRTDSMGSSLTPTAKYTTVTVNTYRTPDTANWLVGLVENARVAKKDSVGGTTIIRERQFAYQAGRSGRVESETIEPNGTPDLKLVHQYGYDSFGNLSSKTTTWRDLQTGVDT